MKKAILNPKMSFLLLLIPIFIFSMVFVVKPKYQDTYMGALWDKRQLLASTEGKKLMVIGGSAAAFALDGDYISSELDDYSFVNFGLYAGLGTKAMLELAYDYIGSEDIVIIMPEQHSQTLSTYFNGQYMWQALDGHMSMAFDLDEADRTNLAEELPAFAIKKAGYFFTNTMPSPQEVYSRTSFDQYGDINQELIGANIMAEAYDPTMEISFSKELVAEDFIFYLNDYAKKCQDKGARVYYQYCPMNQLAVGDATQAEDYNDWLFNRLKILPLAEPEAAIMDSDLFYDTNFHLNAKGREEFSYKLIKSIKAVNGDTSKTSKPENYKLETMAEAIDRDFGIDFCENYIIEEWKDGLTITGIRDAYRDASYVEVPNYINDKRVLRISENAFSEAKGLKTIVIGQGIGAIEDQAFAGCLSLREIRLTQTNPQSIFAGTNLLAGTNAKIYVPMEALDRYKLSYGWSNYANMLEDY